MNSEDIKDKLSRLNDQEREVLNAYCNRLSYRKIGERLGYAEGTIGFYMSVIFSKLELAGKSKNEKKELIHEVFCPVLKTENLDPPHPNPNVAIIGPLTTQEEREVEEMDHAIEVWHPQPLVSLRGGQSAKGISPLLMLLLGMILMAAIVVVLYYAGVIRPATVVEIETVEVPITQEIEVIITTTPAPTQTLDPTLLAIAATDVTKVIEVTAIVTEQAAPSPILLPNILFMDEFNDGNDDGWQFVLGAWRVEQTLGEWEYLCQNESVAIIGDESWKNYRVSVDFEHIGGDSARMGVVGRFVDEDNFYWAAVFEGQREARLRIMRFGEISDLKIVELPTNIDPSKVSLEISGVNLKIYVNDILLIDENDLRFSQGAAGLRCGEDTHAAYDNFLVENITP